MNKAWYFFISVSIILIDQFSKILVLVNYIPYQPDKVNKILNVTLAFNTGSAFSFLHNAGSWHQWFFIGFGILMSAIIIVYMIKLEDTQRLQLFGFSFVLGGALGNVVDRLRLGYVIDFIDLHYNDIHWPVFNIADCAITIGAILLLIEFARPAKHTTKQML